jgi:hypothetical protein
MPITMLSTNQSTFSFTSGADENSYFSWEEKSLNRKKNTFFLKRRQATKKV